MSEDRAAGHFVSEQTGEAPATFRHGEFAQMVRSVNRFLRKHKMPSQQWDKVAARKKMDWLRRKKRERQELDFRAGLRRLALARDPWRTL